jgi:CDP-diacylglycerol--glycerol-3-phosphate 3-phosphatidyltransferase
MLVKSPPMPDVVPAWIAIVIIGREFAVTGLRSIASGEGIVIPAETMGKYKVGAQITAVLALLLDYYANTEWLSYVGLYALWTAMFLAVYSAISYFKAFWKNLS